MKRSSFYVVLASSLLALTLNASARDVVLPAGTLLQCTLNEPNFSSATAAVGDPVLCHLRGQVEFGQQAFPRGSYLVGHLEAEKDPGHFVGKGYLKLQFDRIGLPTGDLPLDTKVIATRGYKVDKEGKIDGKGHAKRDVAEWLLPPLWPWKVMTLPARGPRPALKGESVVSLRLMDDVQLPQTATTYGPGWRFFGRPQSESFHGSAYEQSMNGNIQPRLAVRDVVVSDDGYRASAAAPQMSYATVSASATVVMREPQLNPELQAQLATAAPRIVLVLKSGTLLSVGNYTYRDNRISYNLTAGGYGVLGSDEIDWSTTTKVNAQRGMRVTLRSGYTHPETPGM
jgi:hypothetical protein